MSADLNPDRSESAVREAVAAAFPGLPAGMTAAEAERRVRAAIDAYQAHDASTPVDGQEPVCPVCKGQGELLPGPSLCVRCDGHGTVKGQVDERRWRLRCWLTNDKAPASVIDVIDGSIMRPDEEVEVVPASERDRLDERARINAAYAGRMAGQRDEARGERDRLQARVNELGTVDRGRVRQLLDNALSGAEYSVAEMAHDLEHALAVNDRLAGEVERLREALSKISTLTDGMAHHVIDFENALRWAKHYANVALLADRSPAADEIGERGV